MSNDSMTPPLCPQVVDLAWGLSPGEMETQVDVTPLRIREVQRCHALSAGPNFIVSLTECCVMFVSQITLSAKSFCTQNIQYKM